MTWSQLAEKSNKRVFHCSFLTRSPATTSVHGVLFNQDTLAPQSFDLPFARATIAADAKAAAIARIAAQASSGNVGKLTVL
jgi:hypothetical protein